MINIKIEKKDLWLIAAIIVFLVGTVYVVAYGGNQPSVHGHSAGEIEGAVIVANGSTTGTPSTTLTLPAGTWTVIAWMWNRRGSVPATTLIIDGTTVASFPSMGDPTGTDTGTLMGVKNGVSGDRTIVISTTGITSGFVGVFAFAIRTGG